MIKLQKTKFSSSGNSVKKGFRSIAVKKITFLLALGIALVCARLLYIYYFPAAPIEETAIIGDGWRMLQFPASDFGPGVVFGNDSENLLVPYCSFANPTNLTHQRIGFPHIDLTLANDTKARALLSFINKGMHIDVGASLNVTNKGAVSLDASGAEAAHFLNLFAELPRIEEYLRPHLEHARHGQRFYVVVQAISVTNLTFTFDDNALKQLGGDSTVGKIFSGNSHSISQSSRKETLSQNFSPPCFVLFQAERLIVESAGLNGQKILSSKVIDDTDLPDLLIH